MLFDCHAELSAVPRLGFHEPSRSRLLLQPQTVSTRSQGAFWAHDVDRAHREHLWLVSSKSVVTSTSPLVRAMNTEVFLGVELLIDSGLALEVTGSAFRLTTECALVTQYFLLAV